MSNKGRAIKLQSNLTPRQTAFKNEILKQIKEKGTVNGTEAAIKTYNAKTRDSAHSIAVQNLRKLPIRESLGQALQASGVNPRLLTHELYEMAVAKPNHITGEVKLKTIIELLKLMGTYPDKKPKLNLSFSSRVESMNLDEAKKKFQEITVQFQQLVKDANS